MPNRACWIYNLNRSFMPFFIPFARRLEERGLEPWFLNFWPNELAVLSANGFASRLLDWKSAWPRDAGDADSADSARLDAWLATDPGYLAASEVERGRLSVQNTRFAARLGPALRRLFAERRPACVCVWNGYRFPDRVVIDLCRREGVPVLFFENGFFSHTMQIDPEGINAAGSLSRRSREDWRATNWQAQPRLEEFLRNGGKLPPTGQALPPLAAPGFRRARAAVTPFLFERRWYKEIPRIHPIKNLWTLRQLERRKAAKSSTRDAKLPERFIFLPFQVHDDTQIVVHSPWVRSMEHMLECVLRAVKTLNLPHAVVVKEHPVDVGRFDYGKLESTPGVVWLRDYPLEEILRKAESVVTVNSSVGVETLAHGRPLVTLGEAFYNVEGLVHHAPAEADLPGALTRSLETPVDRDFQKAFLCRVRFHDMVEASWGRPTDQGVENAAARVTALLERAQD